MAITRRQFIQRTGLAAAGSLFGPSFFGNPFVRQAFASTLGDRYFVVIFLDGGNDGLNTITPESNGTSGALRDAYDAARSGAGSGGIRLLDTELLVPSGGSVPPMIDLQSQTQLGFHPGLAGIKDLYDLGKVAVVQGCGYPAPSLSHDDSRHAWQSGSPLTPVGSGWVGRYLADNYTGNDIPAVTINSSVAPEFAQRTTSVLGIRSLAQFAFPTDGYPAYGDVTARRDAFYNLYTDAAALAQDTVKYVGNSGASALLASESYPALSATYDGERPTQRDQYTALNSPVAFDLREVAKVIYGVAVTDAANVGARFFELSFGGYDTHSDQGGATPGGRHFALHNKLSSAIKLFYDDVATMQPGLENKLCIVVWSEFSRRIAQNDNGTDHGTQGPLLVIGGGVTGGVYGNHPNINTAALNSDGNTKYSQDGSDPYRSTDIRDVYGTIMKHWLNMPEPQVLSDVLVPDSGNPNLVWTAPNFDMGFV